MGLDMYLEGRRFISKYNETELGGAIKKSFPALSDDVPITNVCAEVGYWRKANAIHKWFVDNVQDGKDECKTSYVSLDQLHQLRKAILTVLSTRDPNQAHQLLPTTPGFFFGSTEYDEFYFKDLEHTLDIIAKADKLDSDDKYNWDFYYMSSW